MDTPRRMFTKQRHHAKRRGIDWALTYDEWLHWWQQTGHFHERGTCRGQYVMARIGDLGPYALGNIICLLHGQNIAGNLPPNKGEAHAQARFTWEQVNAIRSSKLPYKSLAINFDVSHSTIKMIKAGLRW